MQYSQLREKLAMFVDDIRQTIEARMDEAHKKYWPRIRSHTQVPDPSDDRLLLSASNPETKTMPIRRKPDQGEVLRKTGAIVSQ